MRARKCTSTYCYLSNAYFTTFTGVVAIRQHIYAVGGYDSRSQLRSVERYDAEQNIWEYMASMVHPRSALSATVLDGQIWVFGEYAKK